MANDVVQYARRKRVNDLYSMLKSAIADVVPLLREDSIIQSVQRVLTVRGAYEVQITEYVRGTSIKTMKRNGAAFTSASMPSISVT